MISVVVPSYRTPVLTEAAARSALQSGAHEVIVVDNGADDHTRVAVAAIKDERLRFLENNANLGFGRAANRGGRSAVGDTLVFLNSDASLSQAALAAIAQELALYEGRAVVGPRLIDTDGVIQRSAGVLPGPGDLALRALGIHAIGRLLSAGPLIGRWLRQSPLVLEYSSSETAKEAIDTNMISGACFAIGRDTFWELGGFDERFFMYFEDADLCRRAAMSGIAIRYVPGAVVTHFGGASSKGDYHFSPMHARSMRQYLGKWWGASGAALAILLLWLRLIAHAITFHRGTGKAFASFCAALH